MRSIALSLTLLAAMPVSLGVVSLVRTANDPSLGADAVTCRWVQRDTGSDTMECGTVERFELTPVTSLASASLASLRY